MSLWTISLIQSRRLIRYASNLWIDWDLEVFQRKCPSGGWQVTSSVVTITTHFCSILYCPVYLSFVSFLKDLLLTIYVLYLSSILAFSFPICSTFNFLFNRMLFCPQLIFISSLRSFFTLIRIILLAFSDILLSSCCLWVCACFYNYSL